MSELFHRWHFIRGKRADQERHTFLRKCVLARLREDARWKTLCARIECEAGLDVLIARAQLEFHKAKHAGHPIAYDAESVAAPQGGAIATYLEFWERTSMSETAARVLAVFVEHDLKLRRMDWLVEDLEVLLYFQLLEGVGICVDVEHVLFAGEAVKSGIDRYKSPHAEKSEATMKEHAAMFYRRLIKNPPDSITALAAEFQRDRKSVRGAIDGVIHLLRDPIVRI